MSNSEIGLKSRQVAALKKSILKWEAIVDRTGDDKGCQNCELCFEFQFGAEITEVCKLCPVFQEVGKVFCHGTPYSAWVLHTIYVDGKRAVHDEHSKQTAQDELDFLKGLLVKLEAANV